MRLGHEPSKPLSVGVGIAVGFWCLHGACATPSDSGEPWTSGPIKSQPDAPADVRESPDSLRSTQEISDRWRSKAPAHATAEVTPAEPASESSDEDWLEEAERVLSDETNPSLADPPLDDDADDITSLHARHRVPTYALWVGPGLGWTMPFGDLWGRCVGLDSYGQCAVLQNVSSRDYFGPGLSLELDVGLRMGRNYNLYGLWERTWYASGDKANATSPPQGTGESDFVALGLRVSTDPEKLGFLLDIAVGARRMRARWSDGTQLQFTEAPFETRIGIGADVRLDDHWSFTPLFAIGAGSFGKVEVVNPDGTVKSSMLPTDLALTHGWLGIQIAAHADIFGTR